MQYIIFSSITYAFILDLFNVFYCYEISFIYRAAEWINYVLMGVGKLLCREETKAYMNKRICSRGLCVRCFHPLGRALESSFVSANQCCTAGRSGDAHTAHEEEKANTTAHFTSTIRDIDHITSNTVCYVPILRKGEESSAASAQQRAKTHGSAVIDVAYEVSIHK